MGIFSSQPAKSQQEEYQPYYDGQCDELGREHGYGTMTYKDGSVFKGRFDHSFPIKGQFRYVNQQRYIGELKNNKPNGEGQWIEMIGRFKGQFRQGKFVNGEVHYSDGSIYKGTMIDGKKQGPNNELYFKTGETFKGEFDQDEMKKGIYTAQTPLGSVVYDGEFQKGKKHGEGKLVIKGLMEYQGHFEDDQFSGQGVLKNLKKNSIYEGQFRQNVRHGKGIYKKNGNVYDGQYVNDHRQGQGVYKTPNYEYKGTFVQDKFEGQGVLEYQSGNKYYKYEGQFKCNKRHGTGVLKTRELTYDGEFFEGALQGSGTINYQNGETFRGQFKNNVRHGRGVYTGQEGVMEGVWANDLKEGYFVIQKEEETARGTYLQGQKNGEFIIEGTNGSRRQVWENGRKIYQ